MVAKAWLECIGDEVDFVAVAHVQTLKKISDNVWHASLGDYGVNVRLTDAEAKAIVSGET
jgi:hypothetical protein